MDSTPSRRSRIRSPESQPTSQITEWWQQVAASIRTGQIPRALRFLRWIKAVSPEDRNARLWLLHLSRGLGEHGQPASAQLKRTIPGMRPAARTGLKIGTAMVLSLFCLAMLPFLQLPYGNAEWQAPDTAARDGQVATPTAVPDRTEIQSMSCAELPESGAPLAAMVGEQGIGLDLFERELNQYLTALQESGVDLEAAETLASLPEYRRQVLDALIEDVLVQQAARSAGITVTDDQVDAYLESEVGQAEDQLELKQALEARGQTWERFRREICQDLLRLEVLDEVTPQVPETMPMVWARQIVVATQQDAQNALTRLAAGEAFAELAHELSLDDATRDKGGDLGWFPRQSGLVPPEIEDPAFRGSPGLVQGPILIGEQFYLVQTVDLQSDRPVDAAMSAIFRERGFGAWLASQVSGVDISILVDLYALPAGAAAPAVVPATGGSVPLPGWLVLTSLGLVLVLAGSALHIRSRTA